MTTTSRIRNLALTFGLGAACFTGFVAAPAAALADTPPPAAAAQVQAPPGNPVNHPWTLLVNNHRSLEGWTMEVRGDAIVDIKQMTSYSGDFTTVSQSFDYRAWGEHTTGVWSIDIFDGQHVLQARFSVQVIEELGVPHFTFNRIMAPRWMKTDWQGSYYGQPDQLTIDA